MQLNNRSRGSFVLRKGTNRGRGKMQDGEDFGLKEGVSKFDLLFT
jgi:hypothetical protein